MRRFFYNWGSRDLFTSGLLPTEAYSKTICLGFELTEAVWLRRVKKTLNPFAAAQTISIFFFSEYPHIASKSFLLLPLHSAFVLALPPLHRRYNFFIFEQLHYAATTLFRQPHYCAIPPTPLLRCSANTWWRIILFLFNIIEYGVSWLRKLSEIPTGH